MNRRELLVAIMAAAIVRGDAGLAQQAVPPGAAGRKLRLGYLGVASAIDGERGIKALEQGLREFGYLPGASIQLDARWANGQYERLPELAAELVKAGVDIIIAPTTTAAKAAMGVTTTVPIVFSTVSEPVELGAVESLARPGRNVTGLSNQLTPDVIGKQLQFLRDILPSVRKVAVLVNVRNEGSRLVLDRLLGVAQTSGLVTEVFPVNGRDDLDPAFQAIGMARPDALLVMPDPMLSEKRTDIGRYAVRLGLPTVFGSREDLAPGILLTYGPNRLDLIRRSAIYVDKIIRGAKPADLPIQEPVQFDLTINLQAAKDLGITVPPSVLAGAAEILD